MLPSLDNPDVLSIINAEDYQKYLKHDYPAAIRIAKQILKRETEPTKLMISFEILYDSLKNGYDYVLYDCVECLMRVNTKESLTKAFDMYLASAVSGSVKSQYFLAKGLWQGDFGKVDHRLAEYWFSRTVPNANWAKRDYINFLMETGRFKRIFQIDQVDDMWVNKKTKSEILKSKLIGNVLTVFRPSHLSSKIQYLLYLNGKRIDSNMTIGDCSFTLIDSGIYWVEVVGPEIDQKKIKMLTKPVPYYTEKDCTECDDFLKSYKLSNKEPNSLYLSNYPYCDFIVSNNPAILNEKEKGLYYREISIGGTSYYLISSTSIDAGIIFSGYAYFEKTLIYGQRDLSDQFIKANKEEELGQFTSVELLVDCIKICNDYFGFNHIFYYSHEGTFIVSNRYQLLLKLMLKCNLDVELDKDKVLLSLYSLQGPVFDQLISSEMLVKNTFCLPIGNYLKISGNKINLEKTTYAEVLNAESVDYDKTITDAATDIINNVKSIIDSAHFSHICVDLSGGLDSRLTFGALTNINTDKKVKVRTGGSQGEVTCASNIIEEFGYDYDLEMLSFDTIKYGIGLPIRNSFTADGYLNLMMSSEFGDYDPSKLFSIVKYSECARITGFGGEAFRPWISSLFGVDGNPDVHSGVLFYLFNGYSDLIVAEDKIFDKVVKEIEKAVHDNEGNNSYKKIEGLYSKYYSRYHFDSITRFSYSTPAFTVLMSKNAFKAFNSSLNSSSIIFLFDLMDKLNKKLATFRFEKPSDSVQTIMYHGSDMNYIHPISPTDTYKKLSSETSKAKFSFEDQIMLRAKDHTLIDAMLLRIREDYYEIMKYLDSKLSQQVKMPLWIKIKELSVKQNTKMYLFEVTSLFKRLDTLRMICNKQFGESIQKYIPPELKCIGDNVTFVQIQR